LDRFAFQGLTEIAEDFQAKVSFLILECDGGAQHGLVSGFDFGSEPLKG
jgi:hypothetical protein